MGNYRLLHLLGRGGFATVYLGEHIYLKSQAALKVLHVDLTEQGQAAFLAEAQTLVRLNHPHTVRVLDFAIQDGMPFLVMEYAPWGTLRQLHPHGSCLSPQTVATYVQQVASALQYAHEQRLIHRDVKPENMLLGARQQVLLSDFGLVMLAPHSHSYGTHPNEQSAAGTLAYMAPEQITGRPQRASDQYALGAVVYDWLCGRPPFSGTLPEILSQHLHQPPAPLRERVPELPPVLEQVVLRALAKAPGDRFASVREFAQAFQQAAIGGDISGPYTPSTELAASWEHGESATVYPTSSGTPIPSAGTATGSSRSASQPSDREASAVQTGKPAPPWNVPFLRNPYFTGRDQLLKRLHDQFFRTSSSAPSRSCALSGLGGIGKTQTAIEYAYRYREEYTAVFWVRAASRETLVTDFIAIARLLDLPGQDAQDQMASVAEVQRWLTAYQGWLLILDNADDLELAADFLPKGGVGQVLLTTRIQATGKLARNIAVDTMDLEEGMLLLLRRAQKLAPDADLNTVPAATRDQAWAIVDAVDSLPVALDQAGAYIEETGCSLSAYLDLFARRRADLLKRQSSVSADYPYTVASTWALSFHRVEQESAAAADLLRLCAFLAPDAIPEAIVSEGADALGPVLGPAAADPFLLNGAIQVLRRYSLVKRDAEAELLNLHRLVQVVLKNSLDDALQRQWAERSVRAVNAAFPAVEVSTWPRCEQCLPHVQTCLDLIDQYGFTFPEAAQLLHHAGWYLRERALYNQAEPLLQRARTLQERVLGSEHPGTAATLHQLAVLYRDTAKYEQAESLFQHVLSIRERVLGPEHADLATTLYEMANLYYLQGQYRVFEPLAERSLSIRERIFGPDHPYTADLLNDLALAYEAEGKYEQAEPLLSRALAIFEHAFEPDHPYIAITLNNLGSLYQLLKKYDQAELCLQRSLRIHEQVLGSEHPDVAHSLNNLGDMYRVQGKYDEAESLLSRALAIRERALDPPHQLVAVSLDSLARLYIDQDRYVQAELLLQRALTIFEQVLGPEHLRSAKTLSNLAVLYRAQGRYEQAEACYQRVLAIREHALGPDHPDTVTTREALTSVINRVPPRDWQEQM